MQHSTSNFYFERIKLLVKFVTSGNMETRSDAIADSTNANVTSAKKSSFPFDGIFGPHGFLSTIPCSISEDPGLPGDGSSVKVDGQYKNHGHDHLRPFTKKLKIETTTSTKVTLVIQNKDLPTTEAAFSIDHILENILISLGTPDLLKCRLVCHRWCIVATAELQKTVVLEFSGDRLHKREPRNSEFDICHLTRLLERSSTRSGFPCQKLKVTACGATENRSIRSAPLQQFLNIYGIHIRTLCIKKYSHCINENVALAEIRELLTEQTPSLEHFSLTLETRKGYDAELLLGTNSKNNTVYENKSLKTVYMHTPYRHSLKVLEGILQLAPNLEELTHYDCLIGVHPALGGNYRYNIFWEPLNRLHLLKKVHMIPYPLEIEALDKLFRASLGHPGTLQLKRLTIDSSYFGGTLETDSWYKRERLFVFILNYFFECSSDTLETIKWKNVIFRKGIQWEEMPNVKLLKLDYSTGKDYDDGSHEANIFPPGFGLSTIFPNLRSIKFLYERDEPAFIKFLNRLNPEEEAVNSVRLVRVRDTSDDDAASAEASELLRKFFPKAEIQYPFPLHPVANVCNRYGNYVWPTKGSTRRHK